MRALYLIRHSLTLANEQRLYGGSTDIPLTEAGREIALQRRGALPECEVYISSGMRRADETLALLTGHSADMTLSGLREMDFGAFEMRSYDQLKDDPDYIRWIEDTSGDVTCPGGESRNAFQARVLSEGQRLLQLPPESAVIVCHGGAIVNLMQSWFPSEERHFYQWQPGPCGGYKITVIKGSPVKFEEV